MVDDGSMSSMPDDGCAADSGNSPRLSLQPLLRSSVDVHLNPGTSRSKEVVESTRPSTNYRIPPEFCLCVDSGGCSDSGGSPIHVDLL